ncbi:oxygenase MpaB family protein [Mobilicoccus massiliensis]|uniref:oxygenase MpaB family protein n=1 Tax=Mobilicoccus massiliensis TaxID=1522310 RepID=UPI00058D813C
MPPARRAVELVVGAAATAMRRAQNRLGKALRDRVAGQDAPEAAKRIWQTPGPRWFAEDDPIWIVNQDAAMFPGGIASLLLQSLHPQAMAGVAGHSGYKGDPWGRLQRTSHYLATVTFGTIEHATEAIDHVRGIHERVRGKDHLGRPYRASDPHLLRWVHVAETWCFLAAHQAYSDRPLTPDQADLFVDQARKSGEMLGGTGLPRTVAELDAQLEAFRPELVASPAAKEAAEFLLKEPPLPLAAKPGYALLAAGGIALLPDWARGELDIRMPAFARPVARGAGRFGVAAVRWGMAGLDDDERLRHGDTPH